MNEAETNEKFEKFLKIGIISILVLFLSFIAFIFIGVSRVSALTTMELTFNGTNFTDNNFIVVNTGNATFRGRFVYSDTYVPVTYEQTQYFQYTICTDSNEIINWYATNPNNNSNSIMPQINIFNTKTSCMFPNSTYTGGHLVYIYGNTGSYYSPTTEIVALRHQPYNLFTIYVPNQSSWALLNQSYSNEPFEIDFSSNTIINQNGAIIDGLEDLNNTLNKDYPVNKPPLNKDNINSYEDAEDILLDENRLNAINDIDISLDSNSSDFIWNLVTRILNSHALIFGLVITMLSLGIVKLMLNR